MPKMTTTPPTKSFPPLSAHHSAPPVSTRFAAPSPKVACTMYSGKIHVHNHAKNASFVASTRRSSSIQCHSCHMDLVICKRIVLTNRHTLLQKIGGYNSIYNVEEDVYDEVVMDDDHGEDGLSFGNNNIVNYRAITV
jgi:hypothetical protein